MISPRAQAETRIYEGILVLAILALGTVSACEAANGNDQSSAPYLDLAVALANDVNSHMLNSTSDAYFFSVSTNWKTVTSSEYSTLGNAMMVYGFLQLYRTTGNSTYLEWASSTSGSFWSHAWLGQLGGFLDMYNSNWTNASCDEVVQDNAMFEIDFLSLYSIGGSSVWLQRAASIEELLNTRFWGSASGVPEVAYDTCSKTLSTDAHIEQSIGSYLWATSLWTEATGNRSYVPAMESAYSFASRVLWDGPDNAIPVAASSTRCVGPPGQLGYMRSAYLSPLTLEDCTKGANENVWGAVGIASLYSITGNSSLLAQVDADLTWINATFWDPVNGGYHNDAFRNGTLTSSCAATDDPRDYPGWTNGEQPMFWWYIGTLVDNSTMKAWSATAERWTAQHQWNSTGGNGGEMTCLDSNMHPDSGSTDLFDWIQASAIYSYSAITLASSTTTSAQSTGTGVGTGAASTSGTITSASSVETSATIHTSTPTSSISASVSGRSTSVSLSDLLIVAVIVLVVGTLFAVPVMKRRGTRGKALQAG